MNRDRGVDCVRGILILLVVVGHYKDNLTHDIIFLFHMPLFFILSGYLFKEDKLTDKLYIKKKTLTLFIPYSCYLLFDLLLIRRDFSLGGVVHAIWGGRELSGTYWYMTCFIIALLLFGFLLKHFNSKTIKTLIISGGGYSDTRISLVRGYTFSYRTRGSVEC